MEIKKISLCQQFLKLIHTSKNNFDEIQRVNDSSEYKNLKENWLNQN